MEGGEAIVTGRRVTMSVAKGRRRFTSRPHSQSGHSAVTVAWNVNRLQGPLKFDIDVPRLACTERRPSLTHIQLSFSHDTQRRRGFRGCWRYLARAPCRTLRSGIVTPRSAHQHAVRVYGVELRQYVFSSRSDCRCRQMSALTAFFCFVFLFCRIRGNARSNTRGTAAYLL